VVPSDGLLEVGRIGRAHGVRGDVLVHLTTDRVERLAEGSRLKAGDRWLTVTSASRSNDRWRVHFEGVDDRGAAEALSRMVLAAEPIDDPEVLWVHKLIGARVIEVTGTERGRCVAVVENPAADLLELDSGALVPATFVVSASEDVVTIDPPQGLFELGT
jgi:16S rRNA processing protein RimM